MAMRPFLTYPFQPGPRPCQQAPGIIYQDIEKLAALLVIGPIYASAAFEALVTKILGQ